MYGICVKNYSTICFHFNPFWFEWPFKRSHRQTNWQTVFFLNNNLNIWTFLKNVYLLTLPVKFSGGSHRPQGGSRGPHFDPGKEHTSLVRNPVRIRNETMFKWSSGRAIALWKKLCGIDSKEVDHLAYKYSVCIARFWNHKNDKKFGPVLVELPAMYTEIWTWDYIKMWHKNPSRLLCCYMPYLEY